MVWEAHSGISDWAPLPTATPLWFLKAGMSRWKAFLLLLLPCTFYNNDFLNGKVEVNVKDDSFPKDSFTGART